MFLDLVIHVYSKEVMCMKNKLLSPFSYLYLMFTNLLRFISGNPLGLDPMEITRIFSPKGIAISMVGCELTRYQDFFKSICNLTGGQYVPLRNAELLNKVNKFIYLTVALLKSQMIEKCYL